MKNESTKAKINGFTVIEVFILIVIFAILAAVAVPTLSQARTESKLSDMVSSLQMMRSQLELYKIQHNGRLPGQERKYGEIHPEKFVQNLLEKDPVDGYGPYMKEIPANPFASETVSCDILFLTKGEEACVSQQHGWSLNMATGDFRACNSERHMEY